MASLGPVAGALLLVCPAYAADPWAGHVLKAVGTPVEPKVPVSWDRYYDSQALEGISRQIVEAYPRLAHFDFIGKSGQGRDLWCLTITDFTAGKPDRKPALYIQANIHGNEIQGGEIALYIAWYLTESHGDTRAIQELLADKVFYIVPTVNPDSRDEFIHGASNADYPRGLPAYDGGFHDLDGDGNITFMRWPDPYGAWRKNESLHGSVPGMAPLPGDETQIGDGNTTVRAKQPSAQNYNVTLEGNPGYDASLEALAYGSGYADPNRDWGWAWDATPADQWLDDYPKRTPFSFPETKAVRAFFESHPNICAAYSFHNYGGAIISGTSNRKGDNEDDTEEDKKVYSDLGQFGTRVMPGYALQRRTPAFRDRGKHGEEIDWMFGKRGVYAFIIEHWTIRSVFLTDPAKPASEESALADYYQDLLLGDALVPWHEATDPAVGKVEVGGLKKNVTRMQPGFLLESEAHRTMAFCVHTGFETPKLTIGQIKTRLLADGSSEITAIISNLRTLPTHSGSDLRHAIVRPDYVTLQCPGKVLSATQINVLGPPPAKSDSARVEIPNIEGHGSVHVQWVVSGGGPFTVTVDSIKGGVVSAKSE